MTKNKLYQASLLSLLILIGLIASSYIPSGKFYGIEYKAINVFSDVSKTPKVLPAKIPQVQKEFLDTCPEGMICFEDYSKNKDALTKIFDALHQIHTDKSKVRIGFFGDSFIEGDILTAEVRKQLQNRFGGGGVGFVPITSEIVGFRQTIYHKFKGFNTYNIIANGNAKIPFAAAGYCSYPLPGNLVTYAGVKSHIRLKRFNNIRVFYETNASEIINYGYASKNYSFKTIPSNKLEAYTIKNCKTNIISFVFPPSPSLKLYGVSMEDSSGVIVDNFGMKSNSGVALAKISNSRHKQFDSIQDYKLIVLQYGLNVVGPTTTNLDWYIRSMTKLVKRIKHNYPTASILLLGVSDRGSRQNGKYQTMSTIPLMIEAQRKIAKNCNVAFWDMFSAMGGQNTIVKYVSNSPALANKDYTHLTFKGGEKIAGIFTKTLLYEYKKHNDKKAHNRAMGANPAP
jgi:hypothetical protein